MIHDPFHISFGPISDNFKNKLQYSFNPNKGVILEMILIKITQGIGANPKLAQVDV